MVQDIQAKLKEIENIYGISEYLNGFFLSYDIPRATLVRLGLNGTKGNYHWEQTVLHLHDCGKSLCKV